MKVIFLDIDGVLITRLDCLNRRTHDPPEKPRVDLLNQLLLSTDAKIVVSSSWRTGQTPKQLGKLLTSWGVIPGRVIDKTGHGMSRGEEIQEWLGEHPTVTSFIVIDDDVFDMGNILPRVVKTTFVDGLRPEHIEMAIKMLRS